MLRFLVYESHRGLLSTLNRMRQLREAAVTKIGPASDLLPATLQGRRYFNAVHVRHRKIEDHQVGPRVYGLGDSL
jgi:hypothetical protein